MAGNSNLATPDSYHRSPVVKLDSHSRSSSIRGLDTIVTDLEHGGVGKSIFRTSSFLVFTFLQTIQTLQSLPLSINIPHGKSSSFAAGTISQARAVTLLYPNTHLCSFSHKLDSELLVIIASTCSHD